MITPNLNLEFFFIFIKSLKSSQINFKMNYNIFLDNIKIGISKLDKADAPIGVVFGEITFIQAKSHCEFFSNYCKKKSIKVDENINDKFINTNYIPNLKVYNENHLEINGNGCYVIGMDSEEFEINIV